MKAKEVPRHKEVPAKYGALVSVLCRLQTHLPSRRRASRIRRIHQLGEVVFIEMLFWISRSCGDGPRKGQQEGMMANVCTPYGISKRPRVGKSMLISASGVSHVAKDMRDDFLVWRAKWEMTDNLGEAEDKGKWRKKLVPQAGRQLKNDIVACHVY